MHPDDSDYDDSDVPETGAVFSFGNNLPDKFWIGGNKTVIQVVCGEEHSCILSNVGKAYTFGKNSWGQLGNGSVKPSEKPTFVKSLKEEFVTHIACGRNHSLFFTASNKLFGCGCNGDNQVGLDLGETLITPVVHNKWLNQPIRLLSAGGDYSALVNQKGELFTWGSNDMGQLGIGESFETCGIPQRVSLPEEVIHVSCGHYHMAAVLQNGQLFVWGEEESGKLGLSTGQDSSQQLASGKTMGTVPLSIQTGIVFTPKKVPHFPQGVSMVACGLSHTMVITRGEQRVIVWGEGRSGQLGLGTRLLESFQPMPLERHGNSVLKAKAISAGESHSAVVLTDGSLFTFGDIRHNKLGLGHAESMNQFLPKRVKRLAHFQCELVTCGGCHTLAIAKPRLMEKTLNSTQESVNFGLLTWTQMDQPKEHSQHSTLRESLESTLNNTAEEDQRNRRTRIRMREKRRERSSSRRRPEGAVTLPSLQSSQSPNLYQADEALDGYEELVQVKSVNAVKSSPTNKSFSMLPPTNADNISDPNSHLKVPQPSSPPLDDTNARLKALDDLATLMEADDPRAADLLGPSKFPPPEIQVSSPSVVKRETRQDAQNVSLEEDEYSEDEQHSHVNGDKLATVVTDKSTKEQDKLDLPVPKTAEENDNSTHISSDPTGDSQTTLIKAPPKKTGCFGGISRSKVDTEPQQSPTEPTLSSQSKDKETQASSANAAKSAGCFGGLSKSKVSSAPNETMPSAEVHSPEVEAPITAQPVKNVESSPSTQPPPTSENLETPSTKRAPGCCEMLFATPQKQPTDASGSQEVPIQKKQTIWESLFSKPDKNPPSSQNPTSELPKPSEQEQSHLPEEPNAKETPISAAPPQSSNPQSDKSQVNISTSEPNHEAQPSPKATPDSQPQPDTSQTNPRRTGIFYTLFSKQDNPKTSADSAPTNPSVAPTMSGDGEPQTSSATNPGETNTQSRTCSVM